MSIDGTFITNRKKTFFQGVGLIVAGVVGSVGFGLLTGRIFAGLFGLLVLWGAYLMLRAAKAGRNIVEVEGRSCAVCTQAIPSVMLGKFCDRCGKPIHNDCAYSHTH